MIAENPRPLPPAVMPDPPTRPRPIRLATVGAIQAELGIRADRRLDEYGPTSALSEDLLLRGYGLLPPARHEEGAR